MKRVCIIGHFGFGKQLLNGQTIKTKIITDEIIKSLGEQQVSLLDTNINIIRLPSIVLKVIYEHMRHENIIMMPAHNGLRFFTPILVFVNMFLSRKLQYVVIGGWLPEFLQNRKWLKYCLKKYKAIYVETKSMKEKLVLEGFSNIHVLPNCKNIKIVDIDSYVEVRKNEYRLCTFSRVMKEKGIEDAIKAVVLANSKINKTVFSLDIYGQIDHTQIEWFKELCVQLPDYIKYRGMVAFDRSTEILKDYDALMFPTFYEGEGFAGTAIDAFAAGVPVIASDWKYNSEIIQDKINGFIFPTHNVNEIVNILLRIYYNPDILRPLKEQCVRDAKNYRPEVATKVLINNL